MRDFSTPDFLDDVPPAVAAGVEASRRVALAALSAYGYQLIIPPLVEYLETLTVADDALDRKTFKMTDSVSGRTLGIRADQTPQIARFDALHARHTNGARRYCYCGPVLLTHPPQPWQSREMMQLGAELFGAPPADSDWEMLLVTHAVLTAMGYTELSVDLGHAGLFAAVLQTLPQPLGAAAQRELMEAVSKQDRHTLQKLLDALQLPADAGAALLALAAAKTSDDSEDELDAVRGVLPAAALAELDFIRRQMRAQGCAVGVNLSDLGSYGYHTGIVFCFYAGNAVVARGGRYQPPAPPSAASGLADTSTPPAVGFSMDLYRLPPPAGNAAAQSDSSADADAVHVPLVGDDEAWRAAVADLRRQRRGIRFVAADVSPSPPCLVREGKQWRVNEQKEKAR